MGRQTSSSTTLQKIKPMGVRCSDLRGYSFLAVSLCLWFAGALQFLNLCRDEGTIKWTIFLSTTSCLWACNTSLIRMLRNVSLFNISLHIKDMLVFSSLQTQLFTKHTVKHEWTVLLGNPPPYLMQVLSRHCLNRFFFYVKCLGPTPFHDTNECNPS